jgi:hypothetical protein
MKSGAQVGLAVAAGYLLGRFHKMKWALGLAALGVGKRLAGSKGDVLRQGAKLVSSSPEVSNLTGDLRGRLVEAGKSAATAAVSRKINSLSDTLRERSDALRTAGTPHRAGDQDEEQEPMEEAAEPTEVGAGPKAGRGRESDESQRPDSGGPESVPRPRRRPAQAEGRRPDKPGDTRRPAGSESAQGPRSGPAKIAQPRRPSAGAKQAERRSPRPRTSSEGEPRMAEPMTGGRTQSGAAPASGRPAAAGNREGRR